jgi:methylthioxylose transferase
VRFPAVEGAAEPAAIGGAGAGRVPADAWGVAGWTALIAACWAAGTALNAAGSPMFLGAPPLFGVWDLQLGVELLAPAAAAAAIVFGGPVVARSAPWPVLLGGTAVALGGWAVALALTDGPAGLTDPLEGGAEYLRQVPDLGSPSEFVATYLDRVDGYRTHVRGHPPGMTLLLLWLDGAGLGGSEVAAALMVAVAATAPAAALVAMRTVAGEGAARRAAPFLVLLPAAVYAATTADALYMGVGAWAVAALVVAIVREGTGSDVLAAMGGLLFGVVLFLSYGLVLLAVIPVAVAVAQRRVRPIAVATVGVAVVAVAFLAAGFWWLDGLLDVREQYADSAARNRAYEFFVFNNLAAFALVIGPAVAIGLARLRDPRAWLLVGGGLAAVLLADVSGMSKAEVERIWLPFVPWVALAACALPAGRWVPRALLAAQALVAIAIEAGVATVW